MWLVVKNLCTGNLKETMWHDSILGQKHHGACCPHSAAMWLVTISLVTISADVGEDGCHVTSQTS